MSRQQAEPDRQRDDPELQRRLLEEHDVRRRRRARVQPVPGLEDALDRIGVDGFVALLVHRLQSAEQRRAEQHGDESKDCDAPQLVQALHSGRPTGRWPEPRAAGWRRRIAASSNSDRAKSVGRTRRAGNVVPGRHGEFVDALAARRTALGRQFQVAREEFDVEDPGAAERFREDRGDGRVRAEHLGAALRVVHRDAERQRRRRGEHPAQVVPQRLSPDVAPHQEHARPDDEIDLRALRRERQEVLDRVREGWPGRRPRSPRATAPSASASTMPRRTASALPWFRSSRSTPMAPGAAAVRRASTPAVSSVLPSSTNSRRTSSRRRTNSRNAASWRRSASL